MRNSNEARKKSIAEAAGMGRGNFRTEREKREWSFVLGKKTAACSLSCDLVNPIRLFLEPPIMCNANESQNLRNLW